MADGVGGDPLVDAPPAPSIYGIGRVRRAVKGKGGVDIARTYADVIEVLQGSKFRCLICLRRAAIVGDGKDIPPLSMTSSANIVAHIARCAPWELVAEHAEQKLYKDAATTSARALTPTATGGGLLSWTQPTSSDISVEIALFLLRDARPFLAVEGEGFVDFMKVVSPRLKLPSADTVARNAVLIDEALQKRLTHDILPRQLGHTSLDDVNVPRNAPFRLYTTTTDAWTSRAGMPFLGVTLHYITNDWNMVTHALALRHFPAPHTATRYEELFGAIREENGLLDGGMLGCTTDSASTMIKFAEIAGEIHYRCVAHALHLAIQHDSGIDRCLEPVLRLARFFGATAATRNQIVAAAAADAELELPKAVLPVDTRWNSLLAMLKAHLKRWRVISRLDAKTLQIKDADKAKEYRDAHAACKRARISTKRWRRCWRFLQSG